jgi:hypothetical protein
MINRIIGVLKLDVNTYEEIEADESATSQAVIVVSIVAIVGGLIGGGINAIMGGGMTGFLGSFLQTLLTAYIGWLVWAAVTYFVGTQFFGGQSTMGEMLRVIGFAQAPGILAIIPVCGSFIGWIWSIATGFIAVRQGLDIDNTKAIFTIIIGWVAVFIVSLVIGAVLGAVGLTAGAGLDAIQGLGQ